MSNKQIAQYFHSEMKGAPLVTPESTYVELLALLKAILIEGFNKQNIQTIKISEDRVVVTTATSHGFWDRTVVEVTVAGKTAKIQINESTDTSFTCANNGLPIGDYTSGTVKVAPMGWILHEDTEEHIVVTPDTQKFCNEQPIEYLKFAKCKDFASLGSGKLEDKPNDWCLSVFTCLKMDGTFVADIDMMTYFTVYTRHLKPRTSDIYKLNDFWSFLGDLGSFFYIAPVYAGYIEDISSYYSFFNSNIDYYGYISPVSPLMNQVLVVGGMHKSYYNSYRTSKPHMAGDDSPFTKGVPDCFSRVSRDYNTVYSNISMLNITLGVTGIRKLDYLNPLGAPFAISSVGQCDTSSSLGSQGKVTSGFNNIPINDIVNGKLIHQDSYYFLRELGVLGKLRGAKVLMTTTNGRLAVIGTSDTYRNVARYLTKSKDLYDVENIKISYNDKDMWVVQRVLCVVNDWTHRKNSRQDFIFDIEWENLDYNKD